MSLVIEMRGRYMFLMDVFDIFPSASMTIKLLDLYYILRVGMNQYITHISNYFTLTNFHHFNKFSVINSSWIHAHFYS